MAFASLTEFSNGNRRYLHWSFIIVKVLCLMVPINILCGLTKLFYIFKPLKTLIKIKS